MKANEQLAAYAHEAWVSWVKDLLRKYSQNADGSVTIPGRPHEKSGTTSSGRCRRGHVVLQQPLLRHPRL